MKVNKILLSSLILAASAPGFAAELRGATSNPEHIQVGAVVEDDDSHDGDVAGNPAISVINNTDTATSVNNSLTDLTNLQATAENTLVQIFMNLGELDNAGIIQIDFNNWTLEAFDEYVPDHTPLGKFSYKEIVVDESNTSYNVYFGEWHQDSSTSATDSTRTVWYVGNNPDGYTVPTTGTASYSVTGINQYGGEVNSLLEGWVGDETDSDAESLLTGTLTADFDSSSLSGTLSRGVEGNSAEVVNTLDITAAIETNGTFGSDTGAVVNGSTKGVVEGSFFGTDASTLAGIATFDGNAQYDTAFGGQKQ